MESGEHKYEIRPLKFFIHSSSFILVIFVFLLSTVQAGEYHYGGNVTLACADCHVMHGTQGGQGMVWSGGPGSYTGGAIVPYTRLLKANGIVNLCLLCHENNTLGMSNPTPPDIWNKDAGSMPAGYVPSAGDFADRGSLNELNRHSIGTSGLTPPGNSNPGGWANAVARWGSDGTQFTCIFCHNQHGNANFRNLRYDPGDPSNDNQSSGVIVNYRKDGAGNCSDGSSAPCDVNLTTGPSNLDKFRRDNVTFYKTTGEDVNRIAQWCGRCHTKFYGLSGDAELGGASSGGVGAGDNNSGSPWKRHPVGDINIQIASDTNKHADNNNWFTLTDRTRYVEGPASGINGDEQPFCLSCHYVHGGGNPNATGDSALDHSNLVMFDNNGRINIQPKGNDQYAASSGMIRNTCQQCHNQ